MSAQQVGSPGQPFGEPGPIEELVLGYEPVVLLETVARRKRRMVSRAIGLGISLAILIALYLWRRAEITGASYFVVGGAFLSISVALFVVTLLGFLRSRRELRSIPGGVAVRIGRPGAQVADRFGRWDDVESLAMVRGGVGRSERLRLRLRSGGEGLVPLDQIVVHPATLDSTTRAYSAGRHGVDLSALDN